MEPVILFTHKNGWVSAEFVRFYADNRTLTVTGGHMIYVENSLKRAREVNVGDKLRTSNGYSRIWKRELVIERGLFNPHTEGGNIVVNGFVTSCYTETIDAITAHALLSTVRVVGRWRGMEAVIRGIGTGVEYMARYCGRVTRIMETSSSALAH
ncbi:unnamed protein product [Agarophyton chilense]